MLRECVLDFETQWDMIYRCMSLPTTTATMQASKWPSFELLYSRRCMTSACWHEVRFCSFHGPSIDGETTKKAKIALEHLKVARNCQKSYADAHRWDFQFKEGDKLFLKVSPFKWTLRFKEESELSRRFIWPFEILNRVGDVAYKLALLPELLKVPNVFHVSILKLPDPSLVLHHEPLGLREYATYVEKPIRIIDA